jgi:4-amino-4-deoxy-L-arabinose transferase-like glycosyltransferase
MDETPASVAKRPLTFDPTTEPRTWRLWVAAVFLVALVLRLAKLWANTPTGFGGDEPEYLELARGLARTGEYRSAGNVPNFFQGGRPGELTAYRTPVFPGLLALHFRLFGPSEFYPRLTLVFLSAFTCVLIMIVGRRLISPQAGLVAGACWALWPPALLSWYAADRFYSESLGIFLLFASIVASLRIPDRLHVAPAVIAGLLMGLAVLTRGFLLLVIPVSMVFLALLPAAPARRVQLAGCFLVGLALPLWLWIGRNWLVLGRPLLSTQTEAFYLGNNSWAHGSFSGDMFTLGWKSPQLELMEQRYPRFRQMSELERADAFRTQGRLFVLQNPSRFAALVVRKTLIFWSPLQDWKWGAYRHHFAWAVALPFFALGIVSVARSLSRPAIALLVGPILAVYGAVLMTYAHDRYRFTIEPFVLLIAAAGLMAVWNVGVRRRTSNPDFPSLPPLNAIESPAIR